jgi:tRNA pseudouridine38-40 synthase
MQPGLRTVQGVLQDLLLQITGESIVVEFAGRTDAGVHAAGQVLSFETGFRHGPEQLKRAINSLAPSDVAVLAAEEAPAAFHARRSARQRWYRYTVHNGREPRPLLARYSYFFPHLLDVEAMNAAGAELLGTHDFLAFGDVPGGRESSIRRLDQAEAHRDGDMVNVDLRATAFLKHMARSMVGLLLRAGTGAVDPAEVARVLRERDRHKAGPVAPAKGLCLMGVSYESPLPLGEGEGEGS